jgi:hypothetical protein
VRRRYRKFVCDLALVTFGAWVALLLAACAPNTTPAVQAVMHPVTVLIVNDDLDCDAEVYLGRRVAPVRRIGDVRAGHQRLFYLSRGELAGDRSFAMVAVRCGVESYAGPLQVAPGSMWQWHLPSIPARPARRPQAQ